MGRRPNTRGGRGEGLPPSEFPYMTRKEGGKEGGPGPHPPLLREGVPTCGSSGGGVPLLLKNFIPIDVTLSTSRAVRSEGRLRSALLDLLPKFFLDSAAPPDAMQED